MYPILGRYGPYFLYSYTVIMGIGLAIAVGLTAWHVQHHSLRNWIDGLLVSLTTGMVGGRIGFVVAEWAYFQERPAMIWQIWQGGLSYHGALLAGLLGLWIWSLSQKLPFTTYAGHYAPALAVASAFGWVACYLDGCAFGREAYPGLLTANLPDSLGIYRLRYQTQLIGFSLSILVLWLALGLRQRWQPPQLFYSTLLGLSLAHFITSLLRGDPTLSLGQIRIDTMSDVALAIISLILLQYRGRKQIDGQGADS